MAQNSQCSSVRDVMRVGQKQILGNDVAFKLNRKQDQKWAKDGTK